MTEKEIQIEKFIDRLTSDIRKKKPYALRFVEAFEHAIDNLGKGSEGEHSKQRLNHFTDSETPSEGHVETDAVVWLTAREVGRKLSMSSRWVREHLDILPLSMSKRVMTGRKHWMFHPEVVNILSQYR